MFYRHILTPPPPPGGGGAHSTLLAAATDTVVWSGQCTGNKAVAHYTRVFTFGNIQQLIPTFTSSAAEHSYCENRNKPNTASTAHV
jgi:hypothetical protein